MLDFINSIFSEYRDILVMIGIYFLWVHILIFYPFVIDLIIAYTGTSFRLDPLQFNNVDVDHIYISAGQYRCSINRQSEDWAICL
jgi:hypothetical protein